MALHYGAENRARRDSEVPLALITYRETIQKTFVRIVNPKLVNQTKQD